MNISPGDYRANMWLDFWGSITMQKKHLPAYFVADFRLDKKTFI